MLLICQFATQVACWLKIVRIQTDGIQVEDVRENLQGSAARLSPGQISSGSMYITCVIDRKCCYWTLQHHMYNGLGFRYFTHS